MRYLTKSLFQIGISCPTRMFYARHPETYHNTEQQDEFLEALANGGFQVGALAKLMHPDGIDVDAVGHAAQIKQTSEYLKNDQVTLFEATIANGALLARVDILVKSGNTVDLIEVKAKSASGKNPELRGKRGYISKEWLPYLQDVAFQKIILCRAFPKLNVRCHLMIIDTDQACSVTGLNQAFKVRRDQNKAEVILRSGLDQSSIGDPILAKLPVDDLVDIVLDTPLKIDGHSRAYEEWVDAFASITAYDQKAPVSIGPKCRKCPFRSSTVRRQDNWAC